MKYDYTFFDPTGGNGDTIVDSESAGFQARVAWVMTHGGFDGYELDPYRGANPLADGKGDIVPGQFSVYDRLNVKFHEGAMQQGVDAYLLFKSPEVALVSFRGIFGMPQLSPMPRFDDPTIPKPDDPVGAPIDSYRFAVSSVFTEARWPMGSQFSKPIDGVKKVFERTLVRSSSAGLNVPGGNTGGWAPAWILVSY